MNSGARPAFNKSAQPCAHWQSGVTDVYLDLPHSAVHATSTAGRGDLSSAARLFERRLCGIFYSKIEVREDYNGRTTESPARGPLGLVNFGYKLLSLPNLLFEKVPPVRFRCSASPAGLKPQIPQPLSVRRRNNSGQRGGTCIDAPTSFREHDSVLPSVATVSETIGDACL